MNLDDLDLTTDTRTVTRHRFGSLLLIGLNRVSKRNAFDLDMREQLALAYGEMERDADIRCGVLYAHGAHFTGGLDLAQVSDALQGGTGGIPEGGVDWRVVPVRVDRDPPFSALLTLWLSMIAALGWPAARLGRGI